MSLYWNTPEAVRAQHEYRTEQLRRAARRPLIRLRRSPAAGQVTTDGATREQPRTGLPVVRPLPVVGPEQVGPEVPVRASALRDEPRRPRAGAGSGRHWA